MFKISLEQRINCISECVFVFVHLRAFVRWMIIIIIANETQCHCVGCRMSVSLHTAQQKCGLNFRVDNRLDSVSVCGLVLLSADVISVVRYWRSQSFKLVNFQIIVLTRRKMRLDYNSVVDVVTVVVFNWIGTERNDKCAICLNLDSWAETLQYLWLDQ